MEENVKTCMEVAKERFERLKKSDPLWQFRLEIRSNFAQQEKKIKELEEKVDDIIEIVKILAKYK